ncbi:adenosylhomocysteinase [Microbacterium testaceum]|uniref:adenosylhomocysteinase n=1 Tax=Microbacterium testaceum TaxID=2033 RepID=UPI0012ACD07A|nr:adenosylhomocysteinase [Microbacterium testaceum]
MTTRTYPTPPAPGLEWADAHMPLTREAVRELAPVFDGLRIAMCLHIEPKTAVLVRLLVEVGAQVSLTGSPGTTREDTVADLRHRGVTVHAARDDDAPRVAAVLASDPHLILDNGGDLFRGVLDGHPAPHLCGGTEETTTGGIVLRRREHEVRHPIVVINDSPLKLLVENRFGVGQSVVQAFMNATNLMIPGSRATVIGFGPCGRGTAHTLRQLGAVVTVVDTDPYRALEASLEGFVIAGLDEALAHARFVFLATGAPGVLGAAQIAHLPHGVIIAGVGHHPWEMDLAALGRPVATEGFHATYAVPGDRAVHVIADTNMVNLVAGLGNPIEAMDLGLTLQARSLAAVARGAVATGVHPVPDAVDRGVAEAFLRLRTAS